MNFTVLTPILCSVIRHALVAYGVVELSNANDVSNQAASALVTLIGIGWAFWNAIKNRKSKPK